ncbi:phenoloxidase-activating factor 1-like [Panulirus ornatus]|uniref:phenoloxidase-activating factor 1-like n=1 Tax=Panulirus ornatus TaxID=150431 RepID=UPI003A899FD9
MNHRVWKATDRMVAAKPLLVFMAMVLSAHMMGSTLASGRHARQVRTCRSGTSCEPLDTCQYFQDRLRRPNRDIIAEIQESVCRYERVNPKVCCPVSDSVTPTPTPTLPTLGTRPTQPTPTVNPGNGEALLPASCGQSLLQLKVFHGEDAPLGAFPWMAILGFKPPRLEDLNWYCGGSLITERYVVSAAHCVAKNYAGGHVLTVVRLGEHNRDTDRDCPASGGDCALPVQDFKPEEIIIHPNFDKRGAASDDIFLIRLDRPATFNTYVRPICLPPADLDVGSFVGSRQAVVAGWGKTQESDQASILQYARLPFVDLETCRTYFATSGINLSPEQVCFGGEGARDSCARDSGGPLFLPDPGSANFVLIGVVSFGLSDLGCGAIGVPAVYANVASYRSWITSNLRP